jgi:hypothetical protein
VAAFCATEGGSDGASEGAAAGAAGAGAACCGDAAAGWAAAAMAAAGAMVWVWPLGFVIVTVFVTLLTTTVLCTLV